MNGVLIISFILPFIIHYANGVIKRLPTVHSAGVAGMAKVFAELTAKDEVRASDGRRAERVQTYERTVTYQDRDPEFTVRRRFTSTSRKEIVREFEFHGQIWPKNFYTLYLDIKYFEMNDYKIVKGMAAPAMLDTEKNGSFVWIFKITHDESEEQVEMNLHMHIFGRKISHLYTKIENVNLDYIHIWNLEKNKMIIVPPNEERAELRKLEKRPLVRDIVIKEYEFNVHIWPEGVYQIFLGVEKFEMEGKRVIGSAETHKAKTRRNGSFVWEFELEHDDSAEEPDSVYMHIFDDKTGNHYVERVDRDGSFVLEATIVSTSKEEEGTFPLPPVYMYIYGNDTWHKQRVKVDDWEHVHIIDLRNKKGMPIAVPKNKVMEKLDDLQNRDNSERRPRFRIRSKYLDSDID
uniref:MG2 domain-containing protein n=1 Tax=Globodera pallida TaxID=36090 RepID=A0A183C436_GLOPA